MSNNIYDQQIYGQQVITPNIINIGPITYQQFGQQPIYYGQNQDYIGGVYNQKPKNVGQSYDYHQVTTIPGYENNYQQVQNNQLQNIYQKNKQFNFYQQKNNYQQQTISPQQAKIPMMNQQVIMENKMNQQKSKIQQKLNEQTFFEFTNPHIIQKQVNNISKFNQFPIIKKEALLETRANPMTKDETDELYSYESAICKIKFQTIINGQIKDGIGTGFFLEINDYNIPFKKALFTNNHVLNKNSIEINKEIIFEYCKRLKRIKITENRKTFTNKKLEYTCIEILDTDKINKFFRIDETVFNNKNQLINKEIFILQYPYGKLSHDLGRILDINNNIIKHSAITEEGSSGSPLIKRYNNNLIIGIHYGSEKDEKSDNRYLYNVATPFDIIIKDIKDRLSHKNYLLNKF